MFARLSSHPELLVRKQLEGILILLAKLSPWSIVYPTLVDLNAYEEKPSEELEHVFGCLVMKISFIYLFQAVMYLMLRDSSDVNYF